MPRASTARMRGNTRVDRNVAPAYRGNRAADYGNAGALPRQGSSQAVRRVGQVLHAPRHRPASSAIRPGRLDQWYGSAWGASIQRRTRPEPYRSSAHQPAAWHAAQSDYSGAWHAGTEAGDRSQRVHRTGAHDASGDGGSWHSDPGRPQCTASHACAGCRAGPWGFHSTTGATPGRTGA